MRAVKLAVSVSHLVGVNRVAAVSMMGVCAGYLAIMMIVVVFSR